MVIAAAVDEVGGARGKVSGEHLPAHAVIPAKAGIPLSAS
jgi:hypothetical protein